MSKAKTLSLTSAVLGLTASLATGAALAQSQDIPNLEGTWTNASRTPLTRPRGIEQLVVSAEEAEQMVASMSIAGISPENLAEGPQVDAATGAPPAGAQDFGLRGYNLFWTDPGATLAYVKGEFRTSLVIDPPNGQIPRREDPQLDFERPEFGARYLTGVGDTRGPEVIPIAERCLIGFGNTAGPGMMGTLYNSSYQFVQTDEYVVIHVEMVHEARIIPLFDNAEEARANRRPLELEQWFGDSVGWYEDGSLIVETTNIKPLQLGQSPIPVTKEGRIIERFTPYSDAEIVYQFTVEDDNIYRQPWTAELSYHALDGRIYEYACHEGNYAMPGILAGARRQEVMAEFGLE